MENRVCDYISHGILHIQQEQKVQKRLMRWTQMHSKSAWHSLSKKIVFVVVVADGQELKPRQRKMVTRWVSWTHSLWTKIIYHLRVATLTGKFKTKKLGVLPDLALILKRYIYIEYFMSILFLRLDGKDHHFSPSDLELTGNLITTHRANIYNNL